MSETLRLTGLVGFSGMKVPVAVCASSNLTLSGEQTVDGVTTAESRILLTGQTDQTENGIWVTDTGDWARAQDCDGPYDLRQGTVVHAYGGSANSGFWYCTTANDVDIGTDNITWERASTTMAVINAFWQAMLGTSDASAGFAALAAAALRTTGVISPTALAANTDDWAPTSFSTASVVRISASAAYNLTGIAGGAEGRIILLQNVGSFAITLKNNVTSTAANRFQMSADYVLNPNQGVVLQYDATSARWRIYGQQTQAIENGFRLTLTSGTAVTTSDVTAAGTLYCTPYKSKTIDLYDGTSWQRYTSAEFSLALTLTSGKPYDVFAYSNSGVPALEVLVWTNDTTRATALTTQDGVLVKSGDATRRYLGTLYSSGANTTEDSAANRYLWNYYHRVVKPGSANFTSNRTTTSASSAELNTEIRNSFVIGVAEDAMMYHLSGVLDTWPGGLSQVGVSFDGTTQEGGYSYYASLSANASLPLAHNSYKYPGVGKHYATVSAQQSAGLTLTVQGGGGGLGTRLTTMMPR